MDKARIEKWIEDAKREAIRVCEGGAARRCIPRQDTDTDALLGDGARMMVDVLAHIDALEAERNRLQQAVNEAWDITSEPISSEVEMHPRITQIMDALQDALSKPTLDKYNVKLD